jgi:hypothetical protein
MFEVGKTESDFAPLAFLVTYRLELFTCRKKNARKKGQID